MIHEKVQLTKKHADGYVIRCNVWITIDAMAVAEVSSAFAWEASSLEL